MAVPDKGEYPVKLGSFLFTLVEPTKGHELDYNRWYEHDHFYAGCLDGEHCFAGDRFVATRRMKELRSTTPTDMTPDPMVGSYLAIYWILKDCFDEWNRWAVDRVNFLHANKRMFLERTHIHTLMYMLAWSKQRNRNGTTIELALDRNYPGLVIVAGDVAPGHTHAEVDSWFQDTYLPRAMTTPWGPDVVGSGTVKPLSDDAPADVVRAAAGPRRFLQMHFLDHDPAEGWTDGYAKIGEAINDSGLATHVWTGAFINTVFGTDQYVDELW